MVFVSQAEQFELESEALLKLTGDLDQFTPEKTLEILMRLRRKLDLAENTISSQSAEIEALQQKSLIDPVTGIYNRRGFEAAIAAECERTRRGLSIGGVFMMIDLDNFAQITDTYGPECGEAALKLVATTLLNATRDMDKVSRLAGDEFVIILPDTMRSDILRRTQHMTAMLNNLSLIWNAAEVPIRVSTALKAYSPSDTVDSISAAADRGLYENKAKRQALQKFLTQH
ncbi:MAG: GGDEF domain-containing protein [Pseudobdellovibrionaceae bacterium]